MLKANRSIFFLFIVIFAGLFACLFLIDHKNNYTDFLQNPTAPSLERQVLHQKNGVITYIYGETSPGSIYTSMFMSHNYWTHTYVTNQDPLPYAAIFDKDGIIEKTHFFKGAFGMNFMPYKEGYIFAEGPHSTEPGSMEKDLRGEPWIVTDKNFKEINRYEAVGHENTDGHEILELKNGNILLMSYSREITPNVISCVLQEITPENKLIWEWDGLKHIAREGAYEKLLVSDTYDDYIHCNSVFEMQNGDLLLSNRNTSNVVKIDRQTGNIIWELGGKNSDFVFIDDPFNGFYAQHHAQILENGNVLIYDNGNLHSTPQSRVVEYKLDEEDMTATLVWSYSEPGKFTQATGSVQRLPDGHTLIGWGADASDNTLRITELDQNNKVVLEIHFPEKNFLYRAYKY